MIHPTAVIYPGVIIGDNVYIGPFCVIGAPPEKIGWFDTSGRVVIKDNVRITTHVTIDSGTERVTTIGEGCILLAKSHVGHDVILEKNVILSCGVMIGGWSHINEGCNFGLGAVCHQRTVVPKGCMIGMNTTITKKTQMLPHQKYIGSPAYTIGPNLR